jgi:regulatory protein
MTVTCEVEYKWVIIKLDGELFRKLHVSIIGDEPALPQEADEESLASHITRLEIYGARQYALRKVAAQAMLSMQLRDALEERGVVSEIIEPILTEFVNSGYLNDEDWIASYIRVQKAKKAGPQAIFQKLRMKGVPEKLISPHLTQDNPQDRIRELLASKYSGRNLGDFKERQKVIAALARKGYSFDDILNVL